MKRTIAAAALALGLAIVNAQPADAAEIRAVGRGVPTVKACVADAIVLPCTVNGRIFADAVPHPHH